jgi:hypothetical protein
MKFIFHTVLLFLLCACQSTSSQSSSKEEALPSLDPLIEKAAAMQLATFKCFSTDAAYVQSFIERDYGVSQADAYNLQQKGYKLSSVDCSKMKVYDVDINSRKATQEKNQQAAEKKKAEQLAHKIKRLKGLGDGRVKICTATSDNNSYTNVSFYQSSNISYLELSTYDKHIINAVHLLLSKKEVTSFTNFLLSFQAKADKNNDVEEFSSERFSSRRGSLRLTSHYGKMSYFWTSNNSVDRVLSKPDTKHFVDCISKVTPYLD